MLPSQEELTTLLGSLYDAASDGTHWPSFLRQLADKSGARMSRVAMRIRGQDFETFASSWRFDLEGDDLYNSYYCHLDVWAQRARAKPSGYSCISEQLWPVAEMKRTEVYNDFLVRYGIEHGLFQIVENNDTYIATVSLFRDQSASPFETSDLDILHFLGPHLQRAFKLHHHVSELKARSAGLESGLDMLTGGVIFLGERGQVVLMNRSASASLAEHDGLLATRAGLRAEKPQESDVLRKAILGAASASTKQGIASGGTVSVSRRARPPLQIQVSPIRNSAIKAAQTIAAVAFVNDPLRRQRTTPEVLRAVFGLTPAESRVALLLGDGHAPRRIAQMIGVTDHTIRSQIKGIFSKTGVNRQAELVHLLATTAIT